MPRRGQAEGAEELVGAVEEKEGENEVESVAADWPTAVSPRHGREGVRERGEVMPRLPWAS